MKKLIALLLISVICLSICACGSDNNVDDPPDTPDPIVYGVGDSIYANHPILPCIYGTWKFSYSGAPWEYTMYRTLTLRKDGSGEIDGEPCNWKIEDHKSRPNGTLHISIYRNDVCVYGAKFDRYANGEVYLIAARANGGVEQTTFVNTSYECDHPVHQIYSVVCGTYRAKEEGNVPAQFTLADDGTCKVDGVDGIWYSDFLSTQTEEPYCLGIYAKLGQNLHNGRNFVNIRVFADGKLEVCSTNSEGEIWVEYTRVAD